jgi:5-methylcytosine-specific restriction endonuclease McrA
MKQPLSDRARYMRGWRARNPERWGAIAHKARQKWKQEHREEHREAQRQHRYAVRREILDLLGGQSCVKCGFSDWRALAIDHIHSDGRTDERHFDGVTALWAFRNHLREPEKLAYARTRYQVLCFNCNRIKSFELKEFPGVMKAVPAAENVRRRRVAKPRE